MSTTTSHLFPYYQQELAALRELGAEFANEYPRVAGRLDLGPEASADPQVERLLESVAFLTARIQREVDADFNLLPEALLGILYPHMVAPVPSMAITHIEVDPAQGALSTGYHIPRGTRLYAETDRGQVCWFRTSAPETLWPLRCGMVRMTGPEAVIFNGAEHPGSDDEAVSALLERSVSLLQVRLETTGATPMEALPLQRLRVHVCGDITSAPMLFSLLDACCIGVLVRTADGQVAPVRTARLEAAGFSDDEAVLPDPGTAHPAWRLLQELASFPDKFLFLDIDGLAGVLQGTVCDLLFCFDQPPPAGMKVDRGSVRLGCVPVVNLFRKTSEPLRLTHDRFEYRLLADARLDSSTEIHSVLSVSASSDRNDNTARLTPLFSVGHGEVGAAVRGRAPWYRVRRVVAERPGVTGTDMLVSFVDEAFSPLSPDQRTLYAETLCTNRGLAADLTAGTRLHVEGALPGLTVRLHRRPTVQVAPPMQGETLWRLVSALSLSHLVLADDGQSLKALRELLALILTPGGSSDFGTVVDALERVEVRRTVLRCPPEIGGLSGHPGGFLPGLDVALFMRGGGAVDGNRYLLASVLDRVIALLAGVNAVTQVRLQFTEAASSGRKGRDWKQWPPRAGTHPVL